MGLWPAVSQELVHPTAYGQKHTRDQGGWEWVSTDVLKSRKSSRGVPGTQKMESSVSHLPSPKGVARNLEQEEVGRCFPNFTFQMSTSLLCISPLRMPHPSGVSTTAEKPSPGHLAAALFLCLP